LIENKFVGFLSRGNIEEFSPLPSGCVFADREWDVTFLHDFMPGGLDIQYDYIFEKYRCRILRFMNLLESGRKCLFIRQQSAEDLWQDSIALGEYLRGFHKENCL
jgi:hypothetical protein